ncbi:MAG TPA: hypothetical protein PLV92_22035, partial [Pirellulaceae bacterium]|nr:hypothetical protein [Pirellulaceae bacterium]
YLRLALDGDPLRNVTVQQSAEPDSTLLVGPDAPQLIVVTCEVSNDFAAALKKHVTRGATVLVVPRDDSAAKLFPTLFDDVRLREKANDKNTSSNKDKDDFDYLLFGEIDFSHPLFAPLANPKYSNFTKIHFWRRRAIELTAKTGTSAPGTNANGAAPTSATPKSAATAGATTTGATRAVARFDNGDPAMIEQAVEGGRLIGIASGWQPDESQLALSTRFVPMISALVDLSCGAVESAASVVVHEPMPLALLDRPGASRVDTTIARPDGTSDKVEQGAERYGKTDEPGVYRATRGDSEASCAVNVAGSESDTASLELAQLEQLGVRFGNRVSQAERVSQLRQQRDVELEGRQKIWRWLIVVALVVLIGETLWAGRATRAAQQSAEVAT